MTYNPELTFTETSSALCVRDDIITSRRETGGKDSQLYLAGHEVEENNFVRCGGCETLMQFTDEGRVLLQACKKLTEQMCARLTT